VEEFGRQVERISRFASERRGAAEVERGGKGGFVGEGERRKTEKGGIDGEEKKESAETIVMGRLI